MDTKQKAAGAENGDSYPKGAASRKLGRILNEKVDSLPVGKQHLLATFAVEPRRAFWFRARLKKRFSEGFKFESDVIGGVGRLYCRRLPQSD